MQRGLIRLAVVAVSAASLSAQAGEVCVACAEPAASYRCALEGADPSAIDGPGIQLLCIKELASRAGHKSCSIDRARPCNGPLMLVQRAPGVAPASGPETPAPSGDPAAIPDPGAPPATVEELAKQAAAQSKKDWDKTTAKVNESTKAAGQQIETAGTALGTAAKKTWDCLTSLFANCTQGK